MEILEHGKKYKNTIMKKRCSICGCKFKFEQSETFWQEVMKYKMIESLEVVATRAILCPECGNICLVDEVN